MAATRTIAFLGGEPTYSEPLHVAQLNLPAWPAVERQFRGIFERHYFANHGPLVRELDTEFAKSQGVKHAACVTNGTVALMVLAQSLERSGQVIVPSFTFPATVQCLVWAGLEPVFCDVDAHTHMLTANLVEPLINSATVAVLGVHLWGRPCDPIALSALCARHQLDLIFDGCHAIGAQVDGAMLAGAGRATAMSFHATKVVNGAEGGCILTNDTDLSNRIRTIRSFHPSETYTRVALRFNAKMSEAQAGLALLSLRDLEDNIAANKLRYLAYLEGLADIPGLNPVVYEHANNYQYIVVDIDEKEFGLSRDLLSEALRAENILSRKYFTPGVHQMPPFERSTVSLPVTEELSQRLLQLPNGQAVSLHDVTRICSCIREIRHERETLRVRAQN